MSQPSRFLASALLVEREKTSMSEMRMSLLLAMRLCHYICQYLDQSWVTMVHLRWENGASSDP